MSVGEQVLRHTLDALPVAVEHRGADGRLAYLTPLARELFATCGMDAEALVGSVGGPFDHLPVVDQRGTRLRPSDLPTAACLADGRPHADTLGVPSRRRAEGRGPEHEQGGEGAPAPWILDHRWFHVRAAAVPLLDGSRGVAVTYHDVTQQHHLGEALRQAALHDPLTGLATRRLLSLRFQHSRATAQRTGTRLGLAYIDLDRFRLVNDLLGHLAGDRLLRQVGERLAAVTREADTAARVAGDEFVVLCTGLADEAGMRSAAARIADAVDGTVALGGRRATIGASVGWAMVDRDPDLDAALHRADSAMGLEKARRSIS